MSETDYALEANNLTKRFGNVTALDNVTFAVPPGQILGLIGPNGAGKSTMFGCLVGATPLDAGSTVLNGESITGLRPDQVCHRGMVRTFQTVRSLEGLTTLENVLTSAIFAHAESPSFSQARSNAEHALELVGLTRQAHLQATDLSLPDRKRLELARALAASPSVVLIDEVMAGVERSVADELVDVLKTVHRSGSLTIVVIEHVLRVVMELADRVMVLDNGAVIADGVPADVASDERVIEVYLGKDAAADAT